MTAVIESDYVITCVCVNYAIWLVLSRVSSRPVRTKAVFDLMEHRFSICRDFVLMGFRSIGTAFWSVILLVFGYLRVITCHFLTDNSQQPADKDQQKIRAVAEKTHDAVAKIDTYRNVQRHRAVLLAIARHLVYTAELFCYCIGMCDVTFASIMVSVHAWCKLIIKLFELCVTRRTATFTLAAGEDWQISDCP